MGRLNTLTIYWGFSEGFLSEGQACSLLRVDRVTFREMFEEGRRDLMETLNRVWNGDRQMVHVHPDDWLEECMRIDRLEKRILLLEEEKRLLSEEVRRLRDALREVRPDHQPAREVV